MGTFTNLNHDKLKRFLIDKENEPDNEGPWRLRIQAAESILGDWAVELLDDRGDVNTDAFAGTIDEAIQIIEEQLHIPT